MRSQALPPHPTKEKFILVNRLYSVHVQNVLSSVSYFFWLMQLSLCWILFQFFSPFNSKLCLIFRWVFHFRSFQPSSSNDLTGEEKFQSYKSETIADFWEFFFFLEKSRTYFGLVYRRRRLQVASNSGAKDIFIWEISNLKSNRQRGEDIRIFDESSFLLFLFGFTT